MEKYLFTKFWERWQHGRRKPANVPYKELTKPEEVRTLIVSHRCACQMLVGL